MRLESDFGRYARRLPAVPRRSAAARIGDVHLGAERLARVDRVHVRRAATTRSIQPPYTLVDGAIGKNFGRLDFTIAATNIFNAASGPFTLYDAGVPYRGLYSGPNNTPFLANMPTDALFVQPAAVKFIVTFHE